MPVLNANMKAFYSYVELPKLQNYSFHSLCMNIYCILTRREKSTKKECKCFYFASDTCTFYQYSLLIMSRQGLKRKGLLFPFLCHHFQHKWQASAQK